MEKEIEREEQKLKGKEERVKQKIKNSKRGQAGRCPIATNGRAARPIG